MALPLYQQIYNTLVNEIENNHYSIGERFPSEKEIMENYSVSRITAIHVLKDLENAGYIERRRGNGNKLISFSGSPDFPSALPANTKIIGLILPFLSYPNAQPEHLRYVQGITDYLMQGQYRAVLYTRNDTFDERKLLLRAKADGCHGLICYPEQIHYIFDLLHRIAAEKFPIVLLDHSSGGLDIPVVGPDNQAAQYNLVHKLIEQGHRNIAYYSFDGFDGSLATMQRYLGYDAALRDHGIVPREDWVCILKSADCLGKEKFNNTTPEQLEQLQWELFEPRLKDGCTAVCACDDYQATKIASLFHKKGVDLSRTVVCGFDGLSLTKQTNLPIVTTTQDFYQIGYRAAEVLVNLMEGNETGTREILVPNLS